MKTFADFVRERDAEIEREMQVLKLKVILVPRDAQDVRVCVAPPPLPGRKAHRCQCGVIIASVGPERRSQCAECEYAQFLKDRRKPFIPKLLTA